MTARPFVKWVGGKTQLLPEIRKKYPHAIEKYCEPFVGGGAVLFDVLSSFSPREILINDINPELINTYRCVKECTDELIKALKDLEGEYYASHNKKSCYLEKRARFNYLIENKENTVEKAALFIMLNKTCFNGLYRVNSHSLFNVPFNNSRKPLICDESNIRACGELLKNTNITLGDYSETRDFIDKKTFVYIDPPYRPLTASANFTSYNESGFTDKEQVELGQFIEDISKKGALVLLSNSDPKNSDESDDFFDNLYSSFNIERVSAKRMVNSKGSCRGPIRELLICNKK